MSVTHLDSIEGTRESEGSRKPPQDIPAEQSVLGGMMLSKDAIADVVEILRRDLRCETRQAGAPWPRQGNGPPCVNRGCLWGVY